MAGRAARPPTSRSRWPSPADLPPPLMRTYVRVGGARSCTRTSTRSSRRSSSATTPALRGRPVIVGGGRRAGGIYEAKAFGVRTAMGGARGAAAVPGAVVVPPRFRRTRRPAARSSRSSTTRRRWSRGCRSTRRSSTCAACSGSPARRRRSPCGCGSAVRDEVGLPITVGVARDEVPRQGRERRRPSPTGCCVVPPEPSSRSCTRCRSSALWGVGRRPAQKLHARGITTVGQVAALAEEALVAMLGRALGRQLHALAHNRDPRRGARRPPPALDRRAARARLARRARRRSSTRRSSR